MLDEFKIYVDEIKEPLQPFSNDLLHALVDTRFDFEAALEEEAWGYPRYGWDWERNLTGSSWGTEQELIIKDARKAFLD